MPRWCWGSRSRSAAPPRIDRLRAHEVRFLVQRAVAPAPARHRDAPCRAASNAVTSSHTSFESIVPPGRRWPTPRARISASTRDGPDHNKRQRRAPAQVLHRAPLLLGVAAQVRQRRVRAQEPVRTHHAVLGAGVALHGRLERHVAVLAGLRRFGTVHRAGAVAGHGADVPGVVVVLAAQPALARGDVGAEADLVAGGAEQRLRHQRRPQPRAVRAFRGRDGAQVGLVAAVALAIDVGDRMADQAGDAGLRGARAALDRAIHRAGRDQERLVAVAAEARRDRALLLAERVGGDAVVGVVERREAVRGRRPLRGDVAVAADAVAAADGRARVESLARRPRRRPRRCSGLPRCPARRRRRGRAARSGAGARATAPSRARSAATPATTIAALTPQTQRASRPRGGHGAALRRCGGLPGIPSSGTGERTSVLSTIFPRGAVASPFAAVGWARCPGLPGGPPHWSYAGFLQATGLFQ